MNKFDLINKAQTANLKPVLGKMLVEFILRADDNGFSHVGVARLCRVRGIKHTKNFPWHELHGLSSLLLIKQGKDLTAEEVAQIESAGKAVYRDKNYFWIQPDAIMALDEFAVTVSAKPKKRDRDTGVDCEDSPASAGYDYPADAEQTTLQVQNDYPVSAGCNSTREYYKDSSTRETTNSAASASQSASFSLPKDDWEDSGPSMGNVGRSVDGHYLFEVGTGSGRYLLCKSGVTGPACLTETRPAAPVSCRWEGIPSLHARFHNGEPCPAEVARRAETTL